MTHRKENKGIFAKIWTIFSSVKLSVIVLLLLALTSIIGTFIPQNADTVIYQNQFGASLFKLLNAFDLFDMYHSWWYQLLLFLLTMNLIICSLDRLKVTWKIVFIKKPVFSLKRFQNLSNKNEFTVSLPPENITEKFLQIVESKFAKCIVEKTGNGYCIFSEKGRWTRLGVYAVHISILFMIFGSLVGSFYGFEGYAQIPEKKSTDIVKLKNTNASQKLDFKIRCNQFQVSFYESGAPKEYKSSLTIIEDGMETLEKDIIVNRPLRYKGINIFQSSYGSIPPEEVELNITSTGSGMTYTKKVHINEEILIPEGMGKFVLQHYMSQYGMGGHNLGETFLGVLQPEEGDPSNIILPVKFKNFDKMRKGNVVISVADYKSGYYTGLQITKDPGVYLVYSGFILIIIGCFITFFMSHQSLCIAINTEGDTCQVMIAGTANKNRLGMKRIVNQISLKLNEISS